jgi:Rod binding domain-containing protein
MTSALSLSAPGPQPLDLLNANLAGSGKISAATKAKAKVASQKFEAVFLNSMFQQMFTGIQGDGPFGGSGATGVWRSMLTDEYAKSFAKSGGVGIASHVYNALIAQQEASS